MVREWVGVTLTGVGLMSCLGTPTDSSGLSMLVSFDLAEVGGVPLVGVTLNAGLLVDGTLPLLADEMGLTLGCGRVMGDGSSE